MKIVDLIKDAHEFIDNIPDEKKEKARQFVIDIIAATIAQIAKEKMKDIWERDRYF